MACRYTYKGKTYSAIEFDDVLRSMLPDEASKYMPSVKSVPSAPFIGKTGSWSVLAFKRMIRYAVDNGFEKIAWTTGEQQNDRYDLSKQVDSISWYANPDDTYNISFKKDGVTQTAKNKATESELEDIVGKELAKKIIESAQNEVSGNFSGVDLKVGGEGMKGFYDNILPKEVGKYVKKWGASVGQVTFNKEFRGRQTDAHDFNAHSVEVTPAMRKAALAGQPLFSKKKAAPVDGDIRFSRRASRAATPKTTKAKEAAATIKKFFKRQFTKEGLAPDQVFESKLRNDAEKNIGESELSFYVHDFEQALEEAYGKKFNAIDERDLQDVNAYLSGQRGVALPRGLHRKLDVMRAYLDRLSDGMLDAMKDMLLIEAQRLGPGQLAGFQAYLAGQGGYLPAGVAKHFNLYQKIAANKGEYMTRSYEAFDNKDWMKTALADTGLMARARAYIAQQNPGLTLDQVNGEIRAILEEAREAGNFHSFLSKGTKEGSKDTSILMKRKDVPPVIRELLGEYKDPKVNFVRTATKMQWYLANHHFLMSVRQQGLGVFLFERPQGEYAVKVAGKDSETMNPLNGLYTTADFKQGLEDFNMPNTMGPIMLAFHRFNSAVKYGKTILAPTTQWRNFMSALFFTIMNGHVNYSPAVHAFRVTKADLFTKAGAFRAYTNELVELGVLHSNPYSGELKDALQEFIKLDIYTKSLFQKPKKFLDFMQRSYQAGDDFWKIIGYENELAMQVRAGVPVDQAKKNAAYRIRNGYPTYSMIPRAIKHIRRWPLIGAFVSFPYEITRTSYNQFKFLAEDSRAGRKEMVARRVLGMVAVGGISYAASILSMMALGMDDEDDEAVRKMLPWWSRNSQLLYTGYDENGMPTYYDLSYLDPYTYLKKPISAVMNGNNEGVDDKFLDALNEYFGPYINMDITAGVLFDIARNQKAFGGQVYNEMDAPWDKTVSMLDYARQGLQPGIASNIEKTALAATGYTTRSGKQYKLTDEALAWFGHRTGTLNIPQSVIYNSFSFIDNKAKSSMIMTYVSGSGGDVSEDDMKLATEKMLEARERVYKDMIKVVKAAQSLGMSEDDLADLLEASGVSGDDVDYLIEGEVAPWDMPATFGEKALTRAILSAHDKEIENQMIDEMERRMDWIEQVIEDKYDE